MTEQEFEWDPNKAATNAQKHGITFDDAKGVFADPHVLRVNVTRAEHSEQRMMAIGHIGLRMASVIYTERAGAIRIISARRARRHEREQYRQDSGAG